MAVLDIPESYLTKKTGKSRDEIINLLNMLGFPSETYEDNISVETTPDRLDLLTFEGVVRTLKVYESSEAKEYVADVEEGIKSENVAQRPYIVGFVAKDVEDSDFLYESIITAQEKIHQTFGRKRKKIAIGVHDLNKIKLPLKYVEVEELKFRPLGWDEEASIEEILDKHEKGQQYGHLIKKPFPIVMDEEGVVSLPPIINADRTKISEESRSFLVEITGTDEKALQDVAKVLATAFIDRGGKVSVLKVNGKPSFGLSRGEVAVSIDYVNKISGLDLGEPEVISLLKKSDVIFEGGVAKTPCYRYDLATKRDLVEEVLINYGYGNITPQKLEFDTIGRFDEEFLWVRKVMLYSGFIETEGFFLINGNTQERFFDNIEYVLDAVSREHNSLRATTLLTLISTEHTNQMEPLPHKFFEIGKVFRDGKEFTELGFLVADKEVNVDVCAALIKRLAEDLGENISIKSYTGEFNNIFIEGRSYNLKFGNYEAIIGEIKPEVNEQFNTPNAMMGGVVYKK